jgi:hypothetical protein
MLVLGILALPFGDCRDACKQTQHRAHHMAGALFENKPGYLTHHGPTKLFCYRRYVAFRYVAVFFELDHIAQPRNNCLNVRE